MHHFVDETLGKIAPDGVYHLTADAGWVSVGITSYTAASAVASSRRSFNELARDRCPHPARRRSPPTARLDWSARRLWKAELQQLADATGLVIHVRHYPPVTSKWNKIEHRLLCDIAQTWRGRPLTDRLAVELIAATTTKTGLKVESALDTRTSRRASRSAMPR